MMDNFLLSLPRWLVLAHPLHVVREEISRLDDYEHGLTEYADRYEVALRTQANQDTPEIAPRPVKSGLYSLLRNYVENHADETDQAWNQLREALDNPPRKRQSRLLSLTPLALGWLRNHRRNLITVLHQVAPSYLPYLSALLS